MIYIITAFIIIGLTFIITYWWAKNKFSKDTIIDVSKENTSLDRPNQPTSVDSNSNKQIKENVTLLTKQIEELKDELDDAEYESQRNKRKCDTYKEELIKIKEEYGICEEDLLQSQKELMKSKEARDDINFKLKQKEDSLTFAREMLDAKDADNKDVVELNKSIDKIVSFVEDNNLLNILRKYNKEAKLDKTILWQWANLQRKTWIQRKKIVAFVGEFSAGKTSIVKRILSPNNPDEYKLPVSSKAATAIPTYISYNIDFNSQFTTPLGKLKNISKKTFESVSKEMLEYINVSEFIQHFVISYNNENLKDLSIIDTPGFNSNDTEDAKRTIEVIKEADVLFWVLDANAGEINKTSLSTIRDNLDGLPLYIIINKADTKTKGELENLKNHIIKTAETNNLNINGCLLFSIKAPIDSLLNTIKQAPQNGNMKNTFIEESYRILNEYLEQIETLFFNEKRKLNQYNEKYKTSKCELDLFYKRMERKCKNVRNIPIKKRRFLGEDYYKITTSRYDDFRKELNDITTNEIENLKNIQKKLKQHIESISISENKINDYSNNKNELQSLLNRYTVLINNWNPGYLHYNGLI